MSLPGSLDRILQWHRKNGTPAARLLQPGLTRNEIMRRLDGLPFKMSREFVELYEWRNGTAPGEAGEDVSFFEFHQFLPLEDALSNFRTTYPIMREFYDLTDWVQVFMDPAGDGYGSSGGPAQLDLAPVVFLFEGEGVKPVFDSLARMMETVAVAFDEGAMTWQERELETDFFAWGEVAHRLNPEIQYWREYVKGSGVS